jgi:hypothetical protein
MPYLQDQVQQVERWQTRNRRWLIIAAIVLAVITAGLIYYKLFVYHAVPLGNPQVAAEAPKAVDIPKLEIPPPRTLTVYKRDELLRKIPVAPEVANNPQNQFTAAVTTPAAPYGGTAVAFTNTTTGKSGVSFTPKTRPWYGFGGTTEVGLGVDLSTRAGEVGVGELRQDVVRLWGAQVVGKGEVRVAPQAKDGQFEGIVGARVVYRW